MKLLPQSIFPRLIVLLVAAIVLSQTFSVGAAVLTRQREHYSVIRSQVFEQAEAALRLIASQPPGDRATTLDHLSLYNLCYALTSQPLAPDATDGGGETGRLQDRLRNLVKLYGAGEPRLQLLDEPSDACERYAIVSGRPYAGKPGHTHRFSGIVLSVPLHDGQWFNAHARVVVPSLWETIPLFSILSMAVAAMAAVFGVVSHETRSLRLLARAAERLGRGQPAPRIPESGPSEAVALIRAFNTMQDRLTRFIQDRTRLVAAISHDLRTPLTSLRLKAELLEDGEVAEQMIATIEDMSAIVRSTLEFASADAAGEASRAVELTSFVDSLVEDMAALGMDAAFEESPLIHVQCKPAAIRRAVRNLIENAVRYGVRARVRCRLAGSCAVIEVDDEGPGVPEELLTEVIKPFVRLEESRNPATGGAGLGLAIANDIVTAHGGSLALANMPAGLRASLRIPLPHR